MGENNRFRGCRRFAAPILVIAVAIVTFILLRNYSERVVRDRVAELGTEAVNLMYNFGSLEQLDFQMSGLKSITTDDVFNQLTIDNSNRTILTYFKFKGEPVTVHIIESTDTYVLYWLETKNIASSRKFIFMFDVDSLGRINYVKEAEIIEFVNSDSDVNY